MAIVFGTSTTRFAEFSDPNGGLGQFLDRTRNAVSGALSIIGERNYENIFVESGTQNVPGTSFVGSNLSDLKKPLRRSFTTQHVQATVLVKKRMFSTLRENFDMRFMDDKERTQIRAIKNLFRKKCETIAFYEGLVILEKIVEDPSFLSLDNFMGPVIDAFFNVINLGFGIGPSPETIEEFLVNSVGLPSFLGEAAVYIGKVLRDLVGLKEINERAKQNLFTTWVSDFKTTDLLGTGPGVGVIELTLLKDIQTTVSLSTGAGKCSINIEDPLHLTKISESDVEFAIEQAISDEGAAGFAGVFDLATQLQLEGIEDLDRQLNNARRVRGVSQVNFATPLSSKEDITGTLINFNVEFTQQTAQDSAIFDNLPEEEAFTASELARVLQILVQLEAYNASRRRIKTGVHRLNALFNPIRNKMRAEFVGHSIIQPMDSIHVFANSFTRDDTAVQMSRPDLSVNELPGRFEDQRLSGEFLVAEREILAPDMPQFLYDAVRNPFIWRGTGPQVFSGLVNDIGFSYNSQKGLYHVKINAVDNTKFLELSRVNSQPGLTQPQGVLEDPLTPYDIKVSESTGLIEDVTLSQENKDRLKYMRFDDGPFLGIKIGKENRVIQDTAEARGSRILTYQHAPGMVYKWKNGIISATDNINLGRPTNLNKSSLANVKEDYGLTVAQDPFSNLDTADIMSILITGQPHSYSTFLKNATSASTLTLDNDVNSRGYFNYLFDFLERSNQVHGNFIPAKSSTIDPTQVAQQLRMRLNLKANISSLQSRTAALEDKLHAFPADDSLQKLRNDAQATLDRLLATLSEQKRDATGGAEIRTYGNNTFVHLNEDDNELANKRLKYIVRKRPEDVRYNQDRNYFVVSDKYDTDVDVQAFSLELKNEGPDLYQSGDHYKSPLTKCTEAAARINFEFFADSQGNLQFRPPEYNKIPLSLMKKVVDLSRNDGIELAPKFVINLLIQRAELVQTEVFILDLELYENAVLTGSASIGSINEVNKALALEPPYGLAIKFKAGELIQDADKLQHAAPENASKIFDEEEQNTLAFRLSDGEGEREEDQVSLIIDIRNKLFELRGSTKQPLNAAKEEDRNEILEEFKEYNPEANKNAQANRLRLTNRIATLISKRFSLVTLAAKLTESQREIVNPDGSFAGKGLGTSLQSLAASLDFTGIIDTPQMPRFMRDLVENDIINETGAGDSNRFIINDDVILNMGFSVQPPEFNRIDVFGDENLIGGAISGPLPLVFWAGATDFDSWRQYGARAAQSVQRPAFNNAETQCAPYAVFLLLQQRKLIHRGSITVIGNEDYQAGDVVYVNDRQMLYYVDSVNHNISIEKGTFTTQLNLTYGHCLGEYIPTPWDIIGQTMLSQGKRAFGNIKANRTAVPSNNVVHLETFTWSPDTVANSVDPNQAEGAPPLDITGGSIESDFVRRNFPKIQNAVAKASARIHNTEDDSAVIEVRGYYVTPEDFLLGFPGPFDAAQASRDRADTTEFIELTVKLLSNFGTRPKFESGTTDGSISLDALPDFSSEERIEGIKIVAIDPIDISKDFDEEDAEFRRMPSAKAWANGAESGAKLPTNSIDVVLVIKKSTQGDQ